MRNYVYYSSILKLQLNCCFTPSRTSKRTSDQKKKILNLSLKFVLQEIFHTVLGCTARSFDLRGTSRFSEILKTLYRVTIAWNAKSPDFSRCTNYVNFSLISCFSLICIKLLKKFNFTKNMQKYLFTKTRCPHVLHFNMY